MKPIYLLLTLLATLLPATRLRGADLTAGTHTLSAAEKIYKLSAADGTVAGYNLTTSKASIETQLEIQTNTSGTVTVTLNEFQIEHDTPVTILGTGTVIFKSAGKVVNSITHTGTAAGAVIDGLNATVRFQNTKVLRINGRRIIADNSVSSGSNVIPIRAKQVFFEAGEVACRAVCTEAFSDKLYSSKSLYLTPAVQAESITICGETTVLTPTFLTRSGMLPKELKTDIDTDTDPRSFFDCSELHFTGGKIKQDATAFPSKNENEFKTASRYHYPESAYNQVLNQSNGGALLTGTQATFYFPDWTSFGSADDYLNSFTSSNANAVLNASLLTVDADDKTITVKTSTFPDPALRYTEGSAPDAVSLFGVTPKPTDDGLQVSYAFGIDWIGPVENCVGVRLAVELPAETDDTVSFGITILNAANESVYHGTLPFTRVASGSPLFRSEKVATAQTLANLGLGTAHYRVIATEPAAK